MSELIQTLDGGAALWLIVGLCLLCIGGGVLFVALQFVGFGLDIVFSIVHFFGSIITGGPIAWCGCLVFMLLCGGCGFFTFVLASILPKCGTPEAVNLCRLVGR